MKFMDLLKYLDERFGEASTYASIAALLVALHVGVPSAVVAQATTWGIIVAGVLGVLLRENGKPAGQIAQDMLAQLVAAVKALPESGVKALAWVAIVPALGITLLLGACGMTVAQWAADASAAANAANAVISSLPPGTQVPPVISGGIATIEALATQIEQASNTAAAQPLAQQLVQATDTALPLIAHYVDTLPNAPADAKTAIGALSALAPVVLADLAPTAKPTAAAAAPLNLPGIPSVSVSAARAQFGPGLF